MTETQTQTTNLPSSNPYSWLIKDNGSTRLSELTEIREAYESVPETKAVWKPSQRLTQATATMMQEARSEMLRYLGCWKLPEWYTSYKVAAWVNPNAKDAERYSDVVGECECGARVGRQLGEYEEWEIEHSADCNILDRSRATADLWETRKHALRTMRLYRLKQDTISTRFAISKTTVSSIARRLGMPLRELEAESRLYMAEIIQALLARGHNTIEIGDALGYTSSTISKLKTHQ